MNQEDYLTFLKYNVLPPEQPISMGFNMTFTSILSKDHSMWTPISVSFVAKMAEYMRINHAVYEYQEIFAGRGWMTRELNNIGYDCIGYDWDVSKSLCQCVHEADVADIDPASNADCLLISWPPFGDEIIDTFIRKWPTDKPILYLGEGLGGCTGTESMWNLVEAVPLAEGIFGYGRPYLDKICILWRK